MKQIYNLQRNHLSKCISIHRICVKNNFFVHYTFLKNRSSSSCCTSTISETATCDSSKWSNIVGPCEPQEKCASRECPICFRHYGYILSMPLESPKPFKLDCSEKSDEIGKWGSFYNVVDRVLRKRDNKLLMIHMCKSGENSHFLDYTANIPSYTSFECFEDVCELPARKYKIEDLDRYHDIDMCGCFSTFSRRVMGWYSYIHLFSSISIMIDAP